jgi:hypothetical protein
MRIVVMMDAADPKEWGRVWIAKVVDWYPNHSTPQLAFGNGITRTEAEINAEPGNLIRYGRKNQTDSQLSINKYAIAKPGGQLREVSKHAARSYWLDTRGEPVDAKFDKEEAQP